jgi:hypothetical protein
MDRQSNGLSLTRNPGPQVVAEFLWNFNVKMTVISEERNRFLRQGERKRNVFQNVRKLDVRVET